MENYVYGANRIYIGLRDYIRYYKNNISLLSQVCNNYVSYKY